MTNPAAARVDQLMVDLAAAIEAERYEGSQKVLDLQRQLDECLANGGEPTPPPGPSREDKWKDPHYIPRTKEEVGLTLEDWNLLEDWNDPNTNDTLITQPTDVGHHQKIHGRLRFEGAGALWGDKCLLDGPEDPTIATGETAILDGDKQTTERGLLTNSLIYMKHPHPQWNGFKGSAMSFRGCQMFGVTDGLGPYTKQGQKYATEVEFAWGIISDLCYWPGDWWANRDPKYWNGSSYVSDKNAAWKKPNHANSTDMLGYIDHVHADGTHNDCWEAHHCRGTATWLPDTLSYATNGAYLHNSLLRTNDAFNGTNPTLLPLELPPWGYGDNTKRGYEQKPGKQRPTKSNEWTKPQADGSFAANGVGLYIGQVTGDFYESIGSMVAHDLVLDSGNMHMQEQDKNVKNPSTGEVMIWFTAHDLRFTRNIYRWASTNDRDVYHVRINDYITQNAMPNFDKAPVVIARHPVTGRPANESWVFDDNNQPLPLGSSTVAGIRVM